MPTPVGPAPPDPDDPDLWPEWYDDDLAGLDTDPGPGRFGWPLRLVAVVAIIALALLLVL